MTIDSHSACLQDAALYRAPDLRNGTACSQRFCTSTQTAKVCKVRSNNYNAHSTRDMPRLYSPEPPVMQYAMLTEKTAKSKHAFCITSSAIELWRSFPLLPSRPRGVGPKPTVSHKPQASHPAELWPKPGTQGETLQRFSVEEYCASNLSSWHVVCSTLAVKLLCIEALPGLCMYYEAKHLRTSTPRVSGSSR